MEKLNDCKNGLLYVKISFDDKDLIKNIGGQYNSVYKLWFVNYDVSRTSLNNLLNMKKNGEYIAKLPKYLNKTNGVLDRCEVIKLLDAYVKPKYCCCCGLTLVAIGSRRKNGKTGLIDWSTRSSHKSCYENFCGEDYFKSFDTQTGKRLTH